MASLLIEHATAIVLFLSGRSASTGQELAEVERFRRQNRTGIFFVQSAGSEERSRGLAERRTAAPWRSHFESSTGAARFAFLVDHDPDDDTWRPAVRELVSPTGGLPILSRDFLRC